jgi:hypothetical protein
MPTSSTLLFASSRSAGSLGLLAVSAILLTFTVGGSSALLTAYTGAAVPSGVAGVPSTVRFVV